MKRDELKLKMGEDYTSFQRLLNLVDDHFDEVALEVCENCIHFLDNYDENYGIDWMSCAVMYIECGDGFHKDRFYCSEFKKETT